MQITVMFTKKSVLTNNVKLTLKKKRSGTFSSKSFEASERFTFERFYTEI